MQEQIKSYLSEVENFSAASKEELEQFRIRFLGKKGVMGDLFALMKNVEANERKAFGALVNELKQKAEEKIGLFKESFDTVTSVEANAVDLTLPGEQLPLGSLHPISIVRNRIVQIFERIGFNVTDGPEIEDDWHNFSALNFPPEHPARDMQDTFFVKHSDLTPNPSPKERGTADEGFALRTHTSSVQVRVMQSQPPPIRSIMPGRVYRNEAISARAHCFFHQVEGLYIDVDVSFADLKQTLLYFAKEMFGEKTEIRLRPSYFPFTEPSAEA